MNNIFITGATSYLGKNFIKQCPKFNFFALKHNSDLKTADNLVALSLSYGEISSFLNNEKIDYILHFANSQHSEENNALSKCLCNLEVKTNVKKVIFSGSYYQDIYPKKKNSYIESKNISEKLFQDLSNKINIQSTSLHFGDIYGPFDNREKLIPFLLKNENKKVVHFTSNGMTPFSPLHIKDAINAIKSEIENYNRKNFVTKNIGAPLITTKKFVALYKEIRKKTFIEKYDANKKPDKYSKTFKPDNDLSISLSKGLAEL